MDRQGRPHGKRTSTVLPALATLVLLLAGCWTYAEERPGRTFLWRVEAPTTTIHLLGSGHLMKADAYPLSPAIEDAFDGARSLAFEVDLDQLTGAALKLLAAGSLPEDQRLRDVVSDQTWDLIESRLADLAMDVEGVQRMRPWLLAVSITNSKSSTGSPSTAVSTCCGFHTGRGMNFRKWELAPAISSSSTSSSWARFLATVSLNLRSPSASAWENPASSARRSRQPWPQPARPLFSCTRLKVYMVISAC